MPAIPAHRKMGQENCLEFKVSLGYVVNTRPCTGIPVLRTMVEVSHYLISSYTMELW